MQSIDELISQLKQMKAGNAFRKYIEYIQFPYFRNLERDTKITFDFPLTVFVGQNGSGKSSTLHALYGAPKKSTPFEFWFSTSVDPIVEVSDGGDRHCFFYVYKKDGEPLEVLKLRILKRDNPDYWETSRPVLRYGMKKIPDGSRNEPVEKEVIYIDFRSELSAFDKYFYFKTPDRTKTIKNKQDFLRKYSVFLKSVFDGIQNIVVRYRKEYNEPLKTLSTEELKYVSFILGKKYLSGKMVKHKLFSEWGYSVLFETSTYSYSEAFAGSGEMAVVRLVLEILSAPRYSLVLLDEPEVSLHPGAQRRLKQFILDQIRQKQLQVVISTHSPNIIEWLPHNAIKVFSQLPNGKFNVKSQITPEEAFYHLEQTSPSKKTIIVEDHLAQQIVVEVLESMGPEVQSLFDVTFYSGGHSVLKNKFIPVYSTEDSLNKFILFDGDQNLGFGHFDPDSIIEAEQTNIRYQQEIRRQTGSNVEFYPDGNKDEGSRGDQEKELRYKYLKFYLRNVKYMPLQIPEDIIWDAEFADKLLKTIGFGDKVDISSYDSSKEKFYQLAKVLTGDNNEVDSTEKMFLQKWLQKKDDSYQKIKEIIDDIRTLPING